MTSKHPAYGSPQEYAKRGGIITATVAVDGVVKRAGHILTGEEIKKLVHEDR
jgi:hypothetical protein